MTFSLELLIYWIHWAFPHLLDIWIIFISFPKMWSLSAILYNTFMILHFSIYQIYMSSCHTNYLTFSAMMALLYFYWDIPHPPITICINIVFYIVTLQMLKVKEPTKFNEKNQYTLNWEWLYIMCIIQDIYKDITVIRHLNTLALNGNCFNLLQ